LRACTRRSHRSIVNSQKSGMVQSIAVRPFYATRLVEGGGGKRVIQLAGPREYAPRDVTATLGRIVGKQIVAQQHPEEAMAAALLSAGMPPSGHACFRSSLMASTRVVWLGRTVIRRGVERPTSRQCSPRSLEAADPLSGINSRLLLRR
jgi:uncharacterized protein YbjT (DUF2867 family)